MEQPFVLPLEYYVDCLAADIRMNGGTAEVAMLNQRKETLLDAIHQCFDSNIEPNPMWAAEMMAIQEMPQTHTKVLLHKMGQEYVNVKQYDFNMFDQQRN